ncbi:hypothetical protein BGW80DRAFT_668539 [Lactifluus volemus]|nr:hypothetical protein BGW80DRAFT_668539 [Lactifluus volemus]
MRMTAKMDLIWRTSHWHLHSRTFKLLTTVNHSVLTFTDPRQLCVLPSSCATSLPTRPYGPGFNIDIPPPVDHVAIPDQVQHLHAIPNDRGFDAYTRPVQGVHHRHNFMARNSEPIYFLMHDKQRTSAISYSLFAKSGITSRYSPDGTEPDWSIQGGHRA